MLSRETSQVSGLSALEDRASISGSGPIGRGSDVAVLSVRCP